MSSGNKPPELKSWVESRWPGAELVSATNLDVDSGIDDTTHKGVGYGRPVRLRIRQASGEEVDLVLHTATPNAYGHDRRSDRAAEMLLAYDTFHSIPKQVVALDVGTFRADGTLQSLADSREFYLVTKWAEGAVYADDLRQMAQRQTLAARDRERCRCLAAYLATLHQRQTSANPVAYRRSVRDLVGSGEGIFGIIDGYPERTDGASADRLMALEARCQRWRWQLGGKSERLRQIHGDFHPFNILFDRHGQLSLLDASRGSLGDPADDVTCLAVNYIFFAVTHPGTWKSGLRALWRLFFSEYLDRTSDDALLDHAPPYLTWRLLVLANPNWYPDITATMRDRLLQLAEQSLDRGRLDVEAADELFA
ncbi:MAG: hypothetical protein Tsb0020_55880 [Haliangiales bacterium]